MSNFTFPSKNCSLRQGTPAISSLSFWRRDWLLFLNQLLKHGVNIPPTWQTESNSRFKLDGLNESVCSRDYPTLPLFRMGEKTSLNLSLHPSTLAPFLNTHALNLKMRLLTGSLLHLNKVQISSSEQTGSTWSNLRLPPESNPHSPSHIQLPIISWNIQLPRSLCMLFICPECSPAPSTPTSPCLTHF